MSEHFNYFRSFRWFEDTGRKSDVWSGRGRPLTLTSSGFIFLPVNWAYICSVLEIEKILSEFLKRLVHPLKTSNNKYSLLSTTVATERGSGAKDEFLWDYALHNSLVCIEFWQIFLEFGIWQNSSLTRIEQRALLPHGPLWTLFGHI